MTKHSRRARQPVGPTPLSQLFRDNLRALMGSDRALRTQMAVGKASSVGQTSVGRILNGAQSPTLDMVYKLATAFDIEPWQMLIPGLDPTNPPITKQIDERQKALFQQLRNAAQELAQYKIADKEPPA